MRKREGTLTPLEAEAVFRRVTSSLPERYAGAMAAGMDDTELDAALREALGIFGGSCGPGQPWITHQGSGLKIWATWGSHNHVVDKPLFQGRATIRMARATYGIADPADRQLGLF